MPNLVSLSRPSLPIVGKTLNGGIANFRISCKSLMKESSRNSRTINVVDMKLGPVAKLEKGNKTTSKKFDDDVISENCDVWLIWSNPKAGFRAHSL